MLMQMGFSLISSKNLKNGIHYIKHSLFHLMILLSGDKCYFARKLFADSVPALVQPDSSQSARQGILICGSLAIYAILGKVDFVLSA